jgi:hypothetical protein
MGAFGRSDWLVTLGSGGGALRGDAELNDVGRRSEWVRRVVTLAALTLLLVCEGGCGPGSGPSPLDDPQVDETVKAVQAGKENPRKLRMLLKEKISGKPQEKALPKQPGNPRRTH